jgi:proteasome lid subunit RPN8/RPN11
MPLSSPRSSAAHAVALNQQVLVSDELLDRFLREVAIVHAAGLKSFGLFVADPAASRFPYCATDVVFFDSSKNRRNDPGIRPAFEAQGSYFRSYDDAGFFADSGEVLRVHRSLEANGLEPVAMFHSHRRQPANFSYIDYRLHNPAYPWHLIVSLREDHRPVLNAFEVRKDFADFGIGEFDDNEHSEQAYPGPEVTRLPIISAPQAA